jgi:hypothetical protein
LAEPIDASPSDRQALMWSRIAPDGNTAYAEPELLVAVATPAQLAWELKKLKALDISVVAVAAVMIAGRVPAYCSKDAAVAHQSEYFVTAGASGY